MKHALLVSEFLSTPWALTPERLQVFSGVISRWSQDLKPTDEVMGGIAADREARAARALSNSRAGGGGIAVLPLYGVVTQRGNMVDDVSGPGSVSTQSFAAALQDALNDDAVGSILIDIDSPGGSVYGVSELADQIYQSRGKKPIVAIANSLAASAAYWIGAAASELYVTPGGEVGSIGVYAAHQDISQALEAEGINVQLISAGKFKTEGSPYGPLSDEARAAIQQSVDGYYGMFTKGVSRGRGVSVAQVRDGMGQGRCLAATDALAQDMVDGVMSFDDLVKKMQKSARANRSAGAAIDMPQPVAEVAVVLPESPVIETSLSPEAAVEAEPEVVADVAHEAVAAVTVVEAEANDVVEVAITAAVEVSEKASDIAPAAPVNRLNARKNDLALLQ